MMPQILPIYVKLAMNVHVQVFLAPEMTLAEDYCTCGMKSARAGGIARGTDDAGGWDGAAWQMEVVEPEYNFGTCLWYDYDYDIPVVQESGRDSTYCS